MVAQACHPSTLEAETECDRLKLEDGHQLEASLGYIVSLRPAWVTQQDPVPKPNQTKPALNPPNTTTNNNIHLCMLLQYQARFCEILFFVRYSVKYFISLLHIRLYNDEFNFWRIYSYLNHALFSSSLLPSVPLPSS